MLADGEIHRRMQTLIQKQFKKEVNKMITKLFEKAFFVVGILFLSMLMVGQTATAAQPPGGHLNITAVFVDCDTDEIEIVIVGEDFDFGPGPLSVTLGNFGALPIVGTPTGNQIVVEGPDGLCAEPGDFLLTVATGNGQSQSDEYDLTIGAVGPQGPPGPLPEIVYLPPVTDCPCEGFGDGAISLRLGGIPNPTEAVCTNDTEAEGENSTGALVVNVNNDGVPLVLEVHTKGGTPFPPGSTTTDENTADCQIDGGPFDGDGVLTIAGLSVEQAFACVELVKDIAQTEGFACTPAQ